MRSFKLLLPALVLLSGCETINDAVVRYWYKDPSVSRAVRHQINEGLERRQKRPPVTGPKAPAPPFMDVGWDRREIGGDREDADVFACIRR